MQEIETSHALLGQAIAEQGRRAFAPSLSKWLGSVLQNDNITILAYFLTQAPDLLFARAKQRSVHANFERIYMAGAYLLDPFYDLHVTRAGRGVYRLNEIAPDQFHRNRYFSEYYSGTSLIDELAFVTYPAMGTSVHVCLGRDKTSNTRFRARDIALAKTIAPVVEALVEKHWAGLKAPGRLSEADVTARLIKSLKSAHDIGLSPRQAEVALLILQGNSSVSIGLKLGISPQTVKVFRKQLYRKCTISSQAELFNMMLPLLGK